MNLFDIMKEEILKLYAIIEINENYEKELVKWAKEKLINKVETNSLVLLAGLTENEYNNARELFFESLKELNIKIPEKRNALLFYSKLIAEDILENNIDPNEACDKIRDISIELDFPDVLMRFHLMSHSQYGHEKLGIYAKDLIPDIKKEAQELINKLKTV